MLVEQCYKCHSAGSVKLRGELRLDTREALLKGGTTGPAIVTGDPAKGLLIKAISYVDPDLQMPPKTQLSAAVVDDFRRWIAAGAPWPAGPAPVVAGPVTGSKKIDGAGHWAFAPVRPQTPPGEFHNRSWPATDIDRFVLAKLEAKSLAPAPPADRRTLIRRAYFDLIGLPPTPAEVEAFAEDPSPAAFATVVDRLLASEHYGERWGRYWLDLARYADTNGADENYAYHNAWRYRDYVVRAFNADKPYDRFVTEQLAGDLLPGGSDEQRAERLTATGFLVIGPKMLAEQDKARLVMDLVDEQIDATAQTFLGLTVGCARCHDHKFDPIPTADYYALAGVFKSTKTMANLGFVSEWNERELVGGAAKVDRERLISAIAFAASALDRVRAPATLNVLPPLHARRIALIEKAKVAPLPSAMAVAEDKPQDVPIHLRGNHLTLAKATTPRGFVRVLDSTVKPPSIPPAASGRLQLAQWITDPANPLTARVMVNRIWQGHFGTGLVSTPSNFGLRGQPPTHPELLDYLAGEFVRRGWSVKQMHRLIMLSNTYQQSAAPDQSTIGNRKSEMSDPDNALLSHQNRRRLEAEPIRDALMSVGGNLDLTVGGTLRPLTKEKYSSLKETDPVFDSARRAIYLPIVRSRMYDLFNTFDYVDAGVHTPRRPVTTVPQQALFMLNNPLVARQAELLAERLCGSDLTTDAARIKFAYETLYARPATDREAARALAYVESKASAGDADVKKLAAWSSLCRVLLAANEFVYVN